MKKNKVLVTLSLTLLVLVVGSISVFATVVDDSMILNRGVYSFNDVVQFERNVAFKFTYESNGIEFDNFYYVNDGSKIYYYYVEESGSIIVYDSVNGWVDDAYRLIYVYNDVVLRNDQDYVVDFVNSNLIKIRDIDIVSSGSGLAEDIFELFQSIIAWMVGFFGSFVGLFWTATSGLTVLGVFAVIALGISIFFLIFAVVINFFRFRGR